MYQTSSTRTTPIEMTDDITHIDPPQTWRHRYTHSLAHKPTAGVCVIKVDWRLELTFLYSSVSRPLQTLSLSLRRLLVGKRAGPPRSSHEITTRTSTTTCALCVKLRSFWESWSALAWHTLNTLDMHQCAWHASVLSRCPLLARIRSRQPPHRTGRSSLSLARSLCLTQC